MDNILDSWKWIIWFYVITIFPFQIFDFCKLKDSTVKYYARIIFVTLLVFFVVACTCIGVLDYTDKGTLSGNLAMYILIAIIYIQSIIDLITTKSKRNYAFFGILTLAILTYSVI